MSDSPPPVENKEKSNGENAESNEDLFFSTVAEPSASNDDKQSEDMDEIFNINPKKEISASLDATNEIRLDDGDDEDPFAIKNTPTSNKSSLEQPFALNTDTSKASNINIKPTIESTSNETSSSNSQSQSAPAVTPTAPKAQNKKVEMTLEEEEEDRDKFIDISLSDPIKIGDGMSSYMVYKVSTKTNFQSFKKSDFSTNRRFSDFLNLYEKLKEKHLHHGHFLPPAPEKDMLGTTKLKMSSTKEDNHQNDFLERRKASLERFLNRLAKNPKFKFDPDFRDFLEIAEDLPKATNTSALSGANVMKMFKNVGEAMNKMSIKMPQTDQWFDEKTHEIENLHSQFRKLYNTFETLYAWRRDLSTITKDFAKSTAVLAHSEEHINLAKALTQLCDVHEKIDQLELEQSHDDFFVLVELIKDYIGILDSIKDVFYQRVKLFNNWQKAEETLKMKEDNKTKLEQANKQDKIPAALADIQDWKAKAEKGKQDFESISTTIKQEMHRFEIVKVREFKASILKYLKNLLERQETLVKIWEQFLPEVKAI